MKFLVRFWNSSSPTFWKLDLLKSDLQKVPRGLFTKLNYAFNVSFGNFLLRNTLNFITLNNNFYSLMWSLYYNSRHEITVKHDSERFFASKIFTVHSFFIGFQFLILRFWKKVGNSDKTKIRSEIQNNFRLSPEFNCFWILNGPISDPHCITKN